MRKTLFSILFVLITLGSAHAQVTPRGEDLRAFVRQVLLASDQPQAQQPALMRTAIADHPEVFIHLATPTEGDAMVKEAALESIFRSGSEGKSLQDLSQDLFKNKLLDQIKAFSPSGNTQDDAKKAAEHFSQLTRPERLQYLDLVPDDRLNTVAIHVRSKVETSKFSEFDAIQILLEKGNATNSKDANMQALMKEILVGYFDQMNAKDKTRIFAAILELPADASTETQLSEILQNTGPGLQKAFQLLGRDSQSDVVRRVSQSLQSNIKPFSGAEARAILVRSLVRPVNEVFSDFNEQPIGAATIGQVHIATLKSTGEKVIIKLRRPGVKERAESELALLTQLAVTPTSQEIVKRIRESLEEELDFLAEGKHIEEGYEVYHYPKVGITTTALLPHFPPTEDMLVMKLAAGKKLGEFGPKTKGFRHRVEAVRRLIQVWFDEAIFGSGFFHGDLHPGNLILNEASGKPGYELTLIDFGNVGRMSLAQRRAFIQLIIAAIAKDAQSTLDALGTVGKISDADRVPLVGTITQLYENEPSTFDRITLALQEAVRGGMELPKDLLAFTRGKAFLEKEAAVINYQLGLVDPEHKIPRINPGKIYALTALKRAGVSIPKQLVSRNERNNAVITLKALTSLLYASQKSLWNSLRPCPRLLLPSQAGESAP